MKSTPSSLRLHIGIFGKRNVGKSSVLNAIAGKEVSIVSEEAGTTTDPVKKAMEIDSLGSVLIVDTAGIDDEGALGNLRIKATRKVIDSTDIAILVFQADKWDDFEKKLLKEFMDRQISIILVANKIDKFKVSKQDYLSFKKYGFTFIEVSAKTGQGIKDLKWLMVRGAPDSWVNSPPVLRDLVRQDDIVVQVMPIDEEAPVGRILLPQIQALREVLDVNGVSIVVKETELKDALNGIKGKPDLVVTDSQAFKMVSELTPNSVGLTSYSILFARHKGDLPSFIKGIWGLERLKDGDRILMAEACVHHPISNDIGRVQIPKGIEKFTGKSISFDFVQGKDFPEDLSPYKLIVHCGSCMFNRKHVLSRIRIAQVQNIPITNYGVILGYLNGVLPRAIKPFFKIYPQLEELFVAKN